ncbi:50S ribosomal protein L35 [Staphylococcus saprophyticus]|uniref:50S ribosomal protein L35 n=1 Tax=Staphylococcus saprophyticus TaxID=29385 RepID=UPI0012469377|nr:50S ribosomal protein L35 [Staphylococcus saprophyticus]
MPKIKTHPPPPKPLKTTPSPKLKPSTPFTSHLFPNNSTKQKPKLRKPSLLTKSHIKPLKQLLPYKK